MSPRLQLTPIKDSLVTAAIIDFDTRRRKNNPRRFVLTRTMKVDDVVLDIPRSKPICKYIYRSLFRYGR